MAAELRVPVIIWAAQLMATFMFVVVEYILRAEGNTGPDGAPVLLLVLGFAAVSSAGMSFFIPAQTRKQALAKLDLKTQEQVVEDEPQLFRKAPKTRMVFSNPNKARSAAFRIGMAPFIISIALAESIAIYGFVLARMGFGAAEVAPFFVVAWILMALHFPSEKRFLGPLEKAKAAVFPPAL